MARSSWNAGTHLAILAIGHNAIVSFRFSLAYMFFITLLGLRAERHELSEGEPISARSKTMNSGAEVAAVQKAAALTARLNYAEAASGTDLGQAHEVDLTGVVNVYEHLHPGRQQREYHLTHRHEVKHSGGQGQGSLDEVAPRVLAVVAPPLFTGFTRVLMSLARLE